MIRSKKRLLAVAIVLSMLLSMMPVMFVSAADTGDVDIQVSQDDLLDVVLTLGKTDTNPVSVDTDLINALVTRGVPRDKIKVQAVEANEVSAGNTSSGWEVYDHTNNSATAIPFYRPYYAEVNGNYNLNNHITVSTGSQTNIDFYGYGSPAYKDFMYMPNTQFGKKIFDFTIQEGSFYDALDGAGFLFNTSMTTSTDLANRKMSGYLIFFEYQWSSPPPKVVVYQFTNIDVNGFHNNLSTAIQNGYAGFTKLATFQAGSEKTRIVKIEATSDSLKMWYNGSPVTWTLNSSATTTQTLTLPTDYGAYGFGPLVGYLYHGCGQLTHFTFNNVTMSTESTRRFSEVIRQPEWRENSKRFIINAEDGAVADFSNPVALGEILTRLGNEGIHYLGWGKNASDGLAFIQKNDGNGTFVDKTQSATDTYAEQIAALADYIYLNYLNSVENDTDWLIYGNPSSLTITPESEKTNTIDSEWPNGKWRIDHQEDYFQNPTGVALYDNLYLNNLDISFIETGKYDIYYKDNLIKTVYVHRKPEAGFSVSVNGSLQVSVTDQAFDPDHQTDADKGIDLTTWAYRETTSSTWISGKPTTFASGKEYVIRQTVVDREGESGTPYYRYVSTSSSASAKPVAEFSITPGRLLTYQSETVQYLDSSYDPQGASIVERKWTVSKEGTTIYTGSTPKTSFTGAAAGTYKIALSVRNASNVWSEEVARYLVVVRDTTAPSVTIDLASGTFQTRKTAKVTVTDETGGSGFSSRYAVVDQTATAPTTWGSIGTNAVFSVALNNPGAWYIHVKALDYAGNTTIKNFGPFTLVDNQAPAAPTINTTPSYTTGTWSTVSILLTASGSTDDFTAADDLNYFWSTDGEHFTAGNSVVLSTDGVHTVSFKTTDASGNTSTVTSRTIKVDKTAPSEPDCDADSDGETYAAGSWAVKPVSLTFSGSTDPTGGVFAGYEYRIDDGSWTTGASLTLSTDGEYTVEYRAFDEAGNRSTAGSIIVWLDQTAPAAPQITIRTLDGNLAEKILQFLTFRIFFNEQLEVTITASDLTSGIDSLAWKVGTAETEQVSSESSVTFTIPVGYEDQVSAVSTDKAGNRSETALSDGIILESVKPVISLQTGTDSIKEALDVAITVEDADSGIKTIRTRLGQGDWQTTSLADDETEPVLSKTIHVAVPETGKAVEDFQLDIEVVDLAGNQQTLSRNMLADLVSGKVDSLPDPETATDDEIDDEEEEIRDTKRLFDLLDDETRDDLPEDAEDKLDDSLSRMTQLLVIVPKDPDTGSTADQIGTRVTVPELGDESISLVRIEFKAVPFTSQTAPAAVATALQTLKAQSVDLLQSYDLYLLKHVISQNGGLVTSKVSNGSITGGLTIRLPLPAAYANRMKLQIVYIDDNGQVTPLETRLVTIDGQKYLEFVTDHFSTYAITAATQAPIPVTGEQGVNTVLLLLVLVALAVLCWIRKRLAIPGTGV